MINPSTELSSERDARVLFSNVLNPNAPEPRKKLAKKPTFRPRHFVKQAHLRVTWGSVLWGSAWGGKPGITHLTSDKEPGTHVLEYRDENGQLRGVLARYGPTADGYEEGAIFLMTDPECRRQGIATRLLEEGHRLQLPLDFERQSYTRAGWATVRKFRRRWQQENWTRKDM